MTSCAHPDSGCSCKKCACGVILDSKSPLIYLGIQANQCWRCFQENCEKEGSMNVELLRKIAAVIQEKPAEFRMSAWHMHRSCGTSHCIGGWAQVLSGEKESTDFLRVAELLKVEAVTDEEDYGDLGDCEASRLFCTVDWPNQFRAPYLESDDDGEMAKIAAARIEHFIETGGRE